MEAEQKNDSREEAKKEFQSVLTKRLQDQYAINDLKDAPEDLLKQVRERTYMTLKNFNRMAGNEALEQQKQRQKNAKEKIIPLAKPMHGYYKLAIASQRGCTIAETEDGTLVFVTELMKEPYPKEQDCIHFVHGQYAGVVYKLRGSYECGLYLTDGSGTRNAQRESIPSHFTKAEELLKDKVKENDES